jgi:phosphoserine phosphatase RsbU/P
MAVAPVNTTLNAAHETPRERVRGFWVRITEGLKLQQLWGQFVSDARAGYGLYAKEVDWDGIDRQSHGLRRFLRSAWALFQIMLMKLTPARRVLLLVAIFLLVFQPSFSLGNHRTFEFQMGGVGAFILFVLLALELADRVIMKRDLEIAREIQEWLVPERPPHVPGLDMAFATRPQNTVAGDYYDAFLRPLAPPGSAAPPLLMAVADVAGKSVPAALLMATFQASLRALAATPASLEEIVVGVDRYARAHNLGGLRFTTAFLAEIDSASRQVHYVNAGHNAPILVRASGAIERLTLGGPPFGVPLFTDLEVPYLSGRTELQPGDLLIVFTDGVVEAVDDASQEYGEARLLACLQSSASDDAEALLKKIMADVNAFVGQARQHDDITCFVLRADA